jgi:hypothetical protein
MTVLTSMVAIARDEGCSLAPDHVVLACEGNDLLGQWTLAGGKDARGGIGTLPITEGDCSQGFCLFRVHKAALQISHRLKLRWAQGQPGLVRPRRLYTAPLVV